MISGFVRLPEGKSEPLSSLDGLAMTRTTDETVVWADFDQPTGADLLALNRVMGLDEASLEDCLHGEQRPRIDEFDDYIFIVLYGLAGLDDPSELSPRKLAAFCGT